MHRRRRALWGAVAALAMTALGAGCSPPPPPPPPTVVNLTLVAAPDVNPTPSGAGAPIALRVYQLGSVNAFNGAEFFQLFNQDQATLGADLVKRDDLIVPPGGKSALSLTPMDPVKAVGVFATYRDYAGSVWRVSAPVVPHATNEITVTAGRTGLSIAAKPTPGPGQ